MQYKQKYDVYGPNMDSYLGFYVQHANTPWPWDELTVHALDVAQLSKLPMPSELGVDRRPRALVQKIDFYGMDDQVGHAIACHCQYMRCRKASEKLCTCHCPAINTSHHTYSNIFQGKHMCLVTHLLATPHAQPSLPYAAPPLYVLLILSPHCVCTVPGGYPCVFADLALVFCIMWYHAG